VVLSELSIKRPVLAIVLSAVVVLFGALGFRALSVREYPDIDPPVVSVNTTYRGAAAEIIESQVTQVIEDAVAGIEGIKSIQSSSRDESSSVTIEFTLERDVEAAANDVRDRVAQIGAALPDDADPPRVAKTDADARPILWLVLKSETLSALALTDYAERFLVDRFSTVKGVASVIVGGGRRYAMRIDLDRAALAARQLTVQDIEDAIRRENIDLPSGRLEGVAREFAVKTESGLRTPEQFRALVVREREGVLTRLGEVANVEIGAENDRTELRAEGHAAVGIGIVRQSKANALEVAQGVKQVLDALRPSLPAAVNLEISFDQSVFIERSIAEVYVAISISMALVVGVIFLFLRSFRATLIPAAAIPVSVIGSFLMLAALGYSINVLTLLALVLAIGLVVDDAIVVLENIHRRIEDGEAPLLASVRGAHQIGFAVIATTVVLIAVFVPISFIGGNTGRLFREFGISVAAAVLFSGFVALTLTPMMCSQLLREKGREGAFERATQSIFDGIRALYRQGLDWALVRPARVILLAALFTLAAAALVKILPKELAPTEDRGYFYISTTAPEGASLDYTRRYVIEIENRVEPWRAKGVVERVLSILAPSFQRPGPVNTSFGIVRLKPWQERDIGQIDLVRQVNFGLRDITGVRAVAVNPTGLGQRGFTGPLEVVVNGPDYAILDAWTDRLIARAAQNPGLINVTKDYQPTQPELNVRIDRNRAADLGVSVETLGRTLETMLGSRFVTTFQREGKLYNVVVQAQRQQRLAAQDLQNIYVRAKGAERLVALANLVTLEESAGARDLARYDRLRAITISAALAPGYSLGEALTFLEEVAAQELPGDAQIRYAGQSREFKESSGALYLVFALALVVVFLTLAAQFESFVHPVIILVAVPLALTGALLSMWLFGVSLNVYSQIGLIMLVGLAAKNSILIVDFANQQRDKGAPLREAVRQAASIRLRPILMTSISTMFGALPLALASGAGAEARQALGIVVVGGMGFTTALGLFLVPVLYLLLARYTKPSGAIARRLSDLETMEARNRRKAAE
jgi:multidrug efflux pump